MKKTFKFTGFILILILIILISFTFLLYSPSEDIAERDNADINEILSNSLKNVSLVDGGNVLISYYDIERFLNYKLSELDSNIPRLSIKSIDVYKEENELTFILYSKVSVNEKIKFPISLKLISNVQNSENEIAFELKKLKLSKITLPIKKVVNSLDNKFDIYNSLDNNYIKELNIENLNIILDKEKLIEDFTSIYNIEDIRFNKDGIVINITPNKILNEIIYDNIMPTIDIISKDIEKFENSVTNEKEKEIISKVKNIVTKAKDDNLENIKASDITDILNEINDISEDRKAEITEIFSKNIKEKNKKELINALKVNFSEEELNKIKETFNID